MVLIPQTVVLIPQNNIFKKSHEKYQKGEIYGFWKMLKKYHRNSRQLTKVRNLLRGSWRFFPMVIFCEWIYVHENVTSGPSQYMATWNLTHMLMWRNTHEQVYKWRHIWSIIVTSFDMLSWMHTCRWMIPYMLSPSCVTLCQHFIMIYSIFAILQKAAYIA